MKILAAIILMMTFSAYGRSFECRDGEEVIMLKLDKHVAKINDMTLKNMLRVDWNNRLRSYAFISDPWFDLEVGTEMLKGKPGYAYLSAHDSRGRIVYSKYMDCSPK